MARRSWHLAPSLVRCRNEVNARYPRRDKRSDGDRGDTAHSRRPSAHNPDHAGWVHAWDVDRDGTDIHAIVRAAVAHPATNLVIFNRTIWSRRYGMRPRRYTGANGHTLHAHIEVMRNAGARNSTRPWLSGARPAPARPAPARPAVKPSVPRTLRLTKPHYMRGADVLHAQYKLGRAGFPCGGDSVWGPACDKAMRSFQRSRKLTVDGVCGPASWAALRAVR